MASASLEGNTVKVTEVPSTTTALGVEDDIDLTVLHGLIDSLTVDAATGEDGVNRAMRSLLTCLCKSCEDDNIALFQTIMSSIGRNEMVYSIEMDLLRSSILNGSFRCSRYLVHLIQEVNLCSIMSWMCVHKWDPVTFGTLVERGFSLTDCVCKGMGALKHCIINGNEELVRVCLQDGCSPNALDIELPPDDDHTPELAVNEFSPLMCAILYGNSGIVEKLLQAGADATALEICGMSKLLTAVSLSKSKETALILNAYKQALKTDPEMREFIDIDIQKSLLFAVDMDYTSSLKECMRILVRAGAGVNDADECGSTPLLIAINAKEPDTVAFLLQNGCDLNTSANIPDPNSNGFRQISPLELASENTDLSILTLLLKAGANVVPSLFENETCMKRIKLCWQQFTLAEWCRATVRQNARPASLDTFENLELPQTLKHFLTMAY